jgi:hypothetical protein
MKENFAPILDQWANAAGQMKKKANELKNSDETEVYAFLEMKIREYLIQLDHIENPRQTLNFACTDQSNELQGVCLITHSSLRTFADEYPNHSTIDVVMKSPWITASSLFQTTVCPGVVKSLIAIAEKAAALNGSEGLVVQNHFWSESFLKSLGYKNMGGFMKKDFQ